MTKAIDVLNELSYQRFVSEHPEHPYPRESCKRYKDGTANELTKAVIAYITMVGGQAERISVTGRMIDERKTYVDVLGHARQIGKVKYIKSSMKVGTADVSAVIGGKSVKVEIKVGRDRIRPAQVEYKAAIERAGGIYLIVKTFDDFYNWYQGFRHG